MIDDVSIRPLVERLSFIRDPKRWGYAFRFGHLEMSREDFELIASQMLGKVPATAHKISREAWHAAAHTTSAQPALA